jgi:hypothetical protein
MRRTPSPSNRALVARPWPSAKARTKALVPVVLALWEWNVWDGVRRQRWARWVAERTIREVLPPALRAVGLRREATRCATAGTKLGEEEARAAAAWRAAREAAWAATRAEAAARTEARTAKMCSAVRVAAYAAADAVMAAWAARAPEATAQRAALAAAMAAGAAAQALPLACRIWCECAGEIATARGGSLPGTRAAEGARN